MIQLKTNGALLSPAKSTFEIIIKAEEVFLTEVIGKNKPPVIENINDYLSLKVIRLLEMAKLFPTLDKHALEQNPALENVHSVVLVKKIVSRYLKVRCLTYCHVYNRQQRAQNVSTRNCNL